MGMCVYTRFFRLALCAGAALCASFFCTISVQAQSISDEELRPMPGTRLNPYELRRQRLRRENLPAPAAIAPQPLPAPREPLRITIPNPASLHVSAGAASVPTPVQALEETLASKGGNASVAEQVEQPVAVPAAAPTPRVASPVQQAPSNAVEQAMATLGLTSTLPENNAPAPSLLPTAPAPEEVLRANAPPAALPAVLPPTPAPPPTGDIILGGAPPLTYPDMTPPPAPSAPVVSTPVISTPPATVITQRASIDLSNGIPDATGSAPKPQVQDDYIPPGGFAQLSPSAGEAAPVVITPAATPAVPVSEPVPTLAPDTQKTLKAVPANIDAAAPVAKQQIEVERAKAEGQPANPGTSGAAVRDIAGIRMDARRPALDINYELQRAYDALAVGNSDAAIHIYQQVLDNDASNTSALFGLAATYHRLGQAEKAKPLYKQLLRLNPTHREGLNNFLALAGEEAPQQALEELFMLEQRNPDFSPIPAQIAMLYQKLGRTDEAVAKMSRAISLSPENMTYKYNLAVLFDRAGKKAEAAELYGQLIQAWNQGVPVPGNAGAIQQRLTFLRSTR